MLKLFGYSLGGIGVDQMLDYLREPLILPTSLEGLDRAALQKLYDRLSLHTGVVVLTMAPEVRAFSRFNQLRHLLDLLEARLNEGKVATPAPIVSGLDLMGLPAGSRTTILPTALPMAETTLPITLDTAAASVQQDRAA